MSSTFDEPIEAARPRAARWTGNAPTLLVLVLLLLPLPAWLFPGSVATAQLERECMFWIMTAALVGWIHFAERRSLRSIGLRRPDRASLVWGVIGTAITIGGLAFIYLAIFPAIGETESNTQLGTFRARPFGLRAAMVLRAALFEEFFYRGFMIERLADITGFWWLAALISLAAFTLGHLAGWGFGHLLVAGFGGSVLTILYLWRRDLSATIVAHFLTDGIGLLL